MKITVSSLNKPTRMSATGDFSRPERSERGGAGDYTSSRSDARMSGIPALDASTAHGTLYRDRSPLGNNRRYVMKGMVVIDGVKMHMIVRRERLSREGRPYMPVTLVYAGDNTHTLTAVPLPSMREAEYEPEPSTALEDLTW